MVAHRRTGERAENVMTEDIRGGVEKCINVVKYNKKGEKRGGKDKNTVPSQTKPVTITEVSKQV